MSLRSAKQMQTNDSQPRRDDLVYWHVPHMLLDDNVTRLTLTQEAVEKMCRVTGSQMFQFVDSMTLASTAEAERLFGPPAMALQVCESHVVVVQLVKKQFAEEFTLD